MKSERLRKLLAAVLWQLFCLLSMAAGDKEKDVKKFCPGVVQRSRNHVAVHKDRCYLFVNQEVYWDEARSYCWNMGGELVVIDDWKTMEFIKRELNSRQLGWFNNGVWNGASDLRQNGWEWTTGEKLTYGYWAEGEPSKMLSFLSMENCCCMRRNDGWKWHDYHCHMAPFTYKFICQFPFMHKYEQPSEQQDHSGDRSPVQVRDETGAIVGLAVAGVVLLIVLVTVFYFLYRKQKRQKALMADHRSVRYESRGFTEETGNDSSSHLTAGHNVRPTSHVYLDPMEVSQIYEDINKDTDYGNNRLDGTGQQETARLTYTGGAAADLGDGDACDGYVTPSEVSAATSGYCSSATAAKETDYIEMNGATGGRPSNVYIRAKKMNEPLPPKPNNTEIHVYNNQIEEIEEKLGQLSPPSLVEKPSLVENPSESSKLVE